MMDAIIIDDEQHCIDRLTTLLEAHCSDDITIRCTCRSVDDGLNAINQLRPSVVFLDVMLGDKTGFDLLKELPAVDFDVIFITAFDKYAIEAFRFAALGYLLKPVHPDDLVATVTRLKERKPAHAMAQQLKTLFNNLADRRGAHKRIALSTTSGIDYIQVSDILRCQSEGNYTLIFLTNQKKITVSKTLKEFEELLCQYDFFRVHNSHIVNLAFVKTFNRGKGGHLTMTDNTEIEVSMRRKDDFLKKMSS